MYIYTYTYIYISVSFIYGKKVSMVAVSVWVRVPQGCPEVGFLFWGDALVDHGKIIQKLVISRVGWWKNLVFCSWKKQLVLVNIPICVVPEFPLWTSHTIWPVGFRRLKHWKFPSAKALHGAQHAPNVATGSAAQLSGQRWRFSETGD